MCFFSFFFFWFNSSKRFHILDFSCLRSFHCLLKHILVQQLQIPWVKVEAWGQARDWKRLRHREQRGPLSRSHYPVTLLCFHWHGRSPHCSLLRGLRNAPNIWRVTPVGGVMMEKAMSRGKMKEWEEEERNGADVGTHGEKNKQSSISVILHENF